MSDILHFKWNPQEISGRKCQLTNFKYIGFIFEPESKGLFLAVTIDMSKIPAMQIAKEVNSLKEADDTVNDFVNQFLDCVQEQ